MVLPRDLRGLLVVALTFWTLALLYDAADVRVIVRYVGVVSDMLRTCVLGFDVEDVDYVVDELGVGKDSQMLSSLRNHVVIKLPLGVVPDVTTVQADPVHRTISLAVVHVWLRVGKHAALQTVNNFK